MNKEMVGGCCVCSDERGWQENPLVYCDGKDCNVAVHQACYGIVSVPSGPWFCEKCLSQVTPVKVKCELCPMREGAVKHTDNAGWAHVVCALYIPEVRFGNVTTMDPIILAGVPPDRYNKACYICEEKGLSDRITEGACMQCNKLGCKAAFHVTCAQQEGLLCEESGQMDNIKYCGYCSYHFKKLKRDANIKMVPPYKPIRSINLINNVDNQMLSKRPSPTSNSSDAGLKLAQPHANSDSSPSPEKGLAGSTNRVIGAKNSQTRSSPSLAVAHNGGTITVNHGVTAAKASMPVENHFHHSVSTSSASGNHIGPVPPPQPPLVDPRRHGSQSADGSPAAGGSSSSLHVRPSSSSSFNQSTNIVSPGQLLAVNPPSQAGGVVVGINSNSLASNPSTSSPTASSVIPTTASISSAVNAPLSITRLANNALFTGAIDTLMPPPSAAVVVGGGVKATTASVDAATKIVGDPLLTSPNVTNAGVVQATSASATTFSSSNVAQHKRRATNDAAVHATKASALTSSSTTPVIKKRRQHHNAVGNAMSGSIGGVASNVSVNVGGGGANAAAAAANAKNIANLLTLVTPVVEDTVSSFQREKVQASQQLLLQQQQLQQHQQQQQQRHMQQRMAVEQQQLQATVINGGVGLLQQQQQSSQTHQQQQAIYQQHHNQATNRQHQFDALFASMNPSSGGVGVAYLHGGDKKTTPPSHQADCNDTSAVALLRPSLRSMSSDSQNSAFPSSLEQLLERQWEQGSQFLMEQSQHFDVASLLSCLQQLKVENQRLEDHIVNLISRRDHLLAVNARLSLLLPGAASSSSSGGGASATQPLPSSSAPAHQSPHSPRINAPPAAILPPQIVPSSSHDFHLPNPSSSNVALVSPPRGSSAAPLPMLPTHSSSGAGTAAMGAFNNVVVGGNVSNPYAAAAALLNVGASGKSLIAAPTASTTHKVLQHDGIISSTIPMTATSSSHMPSVVTLPSTAAPPLPPPSAGGAFAVPQQLHAAAAQLAEHMVRSHTPLLPPQFALTQDAHHQQMLFQLMQQQAVAYNNALSGLIQQPTTSPHHHPMVVNPQQQQTGHLMQTSTSVNSQQNKS